QIADTWNGTSNGLSTTTLVDPIADWSYTSAHSANFAIEPSGYASFFNNDDTRASRTDDAAGTVTWNYPGLTSFEMITYHQTVPVHQDTTFETSANGTTWTTIIPTITSDGGSDASWPRFYYKAVGLSGVNYVRATFPSVATNFGYAVKLTQMSLTV